MRDKLAITLCLAIQPLAQASPMLPTICDVVNAPMFREGLELHQTPTSCGWPVPRPCVHFSYYVPKYFIEVVSNAKETFFTKLPGVQLQLKLTKPTAPFGAEDDMESYSFHAHTINIPFAQWAFDELPCGQALPDVFCFSTMSEHLGANWSTGLADTWQPNHKLWALSPKACLLKGAAMSITGEHSASTGGDSSMCSFNMEWLPKYPPSTQPVCTGWGIHFPRTGTVTSSDQTTASLVVASRIRSIGAEVLRGVSISPDEKWQMIRPQTSGCFREGQNIAYLRVKGVNELGRLSGNFKNYLYAIWQRTSCTRDVPWVATTQIWLQALQATCKAWR